MISCRVQHVLAKKIDKERKILYNIPCTEGVIPMPSFYTKQKTFVLKSPVQSLP